MSMWRKHKLSRHASETVLLSEMGENDLPSGCFVTSSNVTKVLLSQKCTAEGLPSHPFTHNKVSQSAGLNLQMHPE